MGSVKDLEVIEPTTENQLGKGIFVFSDRYSVFDWGEMPDHIPNKGAALCMMAAWNFERLRLIGFDTHYLGVLDRYGTLVNTTDLAEPSNKMVVKLSRVIEPKFNNGTYDYSFFTQNRGSVNNFVIPLEVIYRAGAPKGSSLFKTIAKLEQDGKQDELKELLSKYDLTSKPNPGDLFPKVGYDFTTKFEPTDRKLTDQEAYEISGLTREQFGKLTTLRKAAVAVVGSTAKETGLIDYDGKHEYVLFDDEILLADVFGTFDENRFMLNGRQVSKEFLRQYHKLYQQDWYEDVERAKREARELGVSDWTALAKVLPRHLDPRLVNLVGEMYASGSDRYTGLNLFKGARPLEKVMDDLAEFYSE